jgi:hypothetical protein
VCSSDLISIKSEQVKIGGGAKTSINSDLVAIDQIIQLANNQADSPDPASEAKSALPAAEVQAGPPPTLSIPTTFTA